MDICSTEAARTTRDPRAHHVHPRRADVTGAAIRVGESRTARSGRKEKTQHEDDDRRWKERDHISPRDADVAKASPGRPPSRSA